MTLVLHIQNDLVVPIIELHTVCIASMLKPIARTPEFNHSEPHARWSLFCEDLLCVSNMLNQVANAPEFNYFEPRDR
jgi:hypothetical protein